MTSQPERPRISGQREGFALAGALLAMVVVGALVTGSFFAASQEQAIGLTARYNDAALYVAEYGVNEAMASVPKTVLDTLKSTKTITGLAPTGPNGKPLGTDTVWVRPFGNLRVFVSKGVATAADPRILGGRRVLAVVTRTANMAFPMDRAVQVFSGLKIGGSSLISGRDTFPDTLSAAFSQWRGCDTTGLHDAIVAKEDSTVYKLSGASSIIGPVEQDSTMNADDFFKYGDANYDMLASFANITYTGTWNPKPQPYANPDGTCNIANIENWGDPGTTDPSAPAVVPACKSYFPVIHVKGSLTLNSNGRGQGILLVDGDLSITGGFEFWGITVIKGKLSTQGTGGHLYGTVMAYDMGLLEYDENAALGNSVVSLSTCAIERAADNAPGFNRAIPLRMHSWMDLTAAGAGF